MKEILKYVFMQGCDVLCNGFSDSIERNAEIQGFGFDESGRLIITVHSLMFPKPEGKLLFWFDDTDDLYQFLKSFCRDKDMQNSWDEYITNAYPPCIHN